MAAGKKKKPATNPARGFATTSTASKPKLNNTVPTEIEETVKSTAIALHESKYSEDHPKVDLDKNDQDVNINQLSAEEYAEHLERSHLQLLLDTHLEKSTRDVRRHAGRLKTERRLLRSSADYLFLTPWLSQELKDLDIKLEYSPTAEHAPYADLGEDDLLIKTWTLYRILIELDISIGSVRAAVRYFLQTLPLEKYASYGTNSNESVWGLETSLEWLARHAPPQDLVNSVDIDEAGKSLEVDRSSVMPPSSGFASPVQTADAELVGTRHEWPLQAPETSLNQRMADPPKILGSTESPIIAPTTPQACVSESESGSDDDPEMMVERYSKLLLRLNEIDAGLARIKHGNLTQKSSKGLQIKDKQPLEAARILKKMTKIETDALFDRYDAAEKWVELRNSQVKELAERGKFRLSKDKITQGRVVPSGLTEGPDNEASEQDDDDVLDTLGDFLSELPNENGKVIEQIERNDSSVSDTATTVRNFGNTSGIRPRRVLEETCKSRSVQSDRFDPLRSPSFFFLIQYVQKSKQS